MCAAGSHEITLRAGVEPDHLLDRLRPGHDVVVGQLHALRRPGRARGVDQRHEVVGADLRDGRRRGRSPGPSLRRRRARSCPPGASPSTTITCSSAGHVLARLEQRARCRPARRSPPCEPASSSRYWISAGRIGQVDRERRRAERRRREVDDVELGPVAEHDRDRVAAPDARASPARRRPSRRAASSSDQVSETLSSGVRTATISGWLAAVRRSASVTVGASTARPAAGEIVLLLSIRLLLHRRARMRCVPYQRGAGRSSAADAAR